jgi:DNA mismatch repair protein MutS
MQIDPLSLSELQVLESIGATSILTLVDRTVTPGGRSRLIALLSHPLGSSDAIRGRQASLQFIAAHDAAFDLKWVAPTIEAANRYLDSKWQELPEGSLGCAYARWRHRDQFRDVTMGMGAVATLVDVAHAMARMRDVVPARCDELHAICEQARCVTDDATFKRLAELHRGAGRLPLGAARLDARLRNRGETRDLLRVWLEALALIDALRSLSRPPAGFHYPAIVDAVQPRVEIEGLIHPLVSAPVAADVSFALDQRVLFVTGPNMGGKTTLMRAAALVVYLAHVGMAVPGRATLSIFDRVFAAVNVRDSIQRGESFFLAEVRRIGMLVDALDRDERTFAVVDEAFKGTNVTDAREATTLLARGLAGCAHGRFIVASHLTEAADDMVNDARIQLLQMTAQRDGDRWRFDYRLEPGVSRTRLGLALLDRERVGPSLRRLAAGAGPMARETMAVTPATVPRSGP